MTAPCPALRLALARKNQRICSKGRPIMRIAELPAARFLLHQSHRVPLPQQNQSMSARTRTMKMRMAGLPAARLLQLESNISRFTGGADISTSLPCGRWLSDPRWRCPTEEAQGGVRACR